MGTAYWWLFLRTHFLVFSLSWSIHTSKIAEFLICTGTMATLHTSMTIMLHLQMLGVSILPGYKSPRPWFQRVCLNLEKRLGNKTNDTRWDLKCCCGLYILQWTNYFSHLIEQSPHVKVLIHTSTVYQYVLSILELLVGKSTRTFVSCNFRAEQHQVMAINNITEYNNISEPSCWWPLNTDQLQATSHTDQLLATS